MDREYIAKKLLEIKAVELNTEIPYKWYSGLWAPIYCDNRKILSYSDFRTEIKRRLTEYIIRNFKRVDTIAGIATGSIAFAALVADYLNLPMVYVRTKRKEHGLQKQVEGQLKHKANVVVIEDLISTGFNSLSAVDILRDNEANILGLLSIFSYQLEEAVNNLKNKDIKWYTLTDYHTLINVAYRDGYITNEQLSVLKKWHSNPFSYYAEYQ